MHSGRGRVAAVEALRPLGVLGALVVIFPEFAARPAVVKLGTHPAGQLCLR